jgi:hypothetical protein
MAVYEYKVLMQVDNDTSPDEARGFVERGLGTQLPIHGYLVICADDEPNLFDSADEYDQSVDK